MKRTLSLFLALALALSLAIPALADEAPVVLTVGVPDHPLVQDWETNQQTLLIEKTCNVDLQFVKLPYDNKERQQKLELSMLAGGTDLPDILINPNFDLASLMQYGDMGMIVPLNDYMDNTPYLDAGLANRTVVPVTKEEYLTNITCADGKIYGLAYCFMTINNSLSGCRLMIYKPWLDKLGLEVPNTTEELLTVLRAFRDRDPNGNGKQDELPLVTSNNFLPTMMKPLMNPFIYYQDNFVSNEDGTLVFNAVQDGWKEGLAYIKMLVDEGLLSTLSFTQDNAQATALMAQDEVIVGCFGRNSASNLPTTDPRREEYVTVGALEGPSGLKQQTQIETGYFMRFVITTQCKDIEAAMRVGDFLSSIEINDIARYGFEDQNWERLTGDEIGESQYASLGFQGEIREFNPVWGVAQNVHWVQQGPYTGDGSTITYRLIVSAKEGVYDHSTPIGAGIKRELDYANTKNRVGNMIFTAEEQEIITEYRATINDAVMTALADFTTGVRSLDKDWDAYVASLHAMGLEPYMAAMQSCWDRMQGK